MSFNYHTRIRYVKNPDGTYESMQIFRGSGGGEFRALISLDGKEGYILSMPDRAVKVKVNATSPHKTRIKLKAAMKSFGVVFLNEERFMLDI